MIILTDLTWGLGVVDGLCWCGENAVWPPVATGLVTAGVVMETGARTVPGWSPPSTRRVFGGRLVIRLFLCIALIASILLILFIYLVGVALLVFITCAWPDLSSRVTWPAFRSLIGPLAIFTHCPFKMASCGIPATTNPTLFLACLADITLGMAIANGGLFPIELFTFTVPTVPIKLGEVTVGVPIELIRPVVLVMAPVVAPLPLLRRFLALDEPVDSTGVEGKEAEIVPLVPSRVGLGLFMLRLKLLVCLLRGFCFTINLFGTDAITVFSLCTGMPCAALEPSIRLNS